MQIKKKIALLLSAAMLLTSVNISPYTVHAEAGSPSPGNTTVVKLTKYGLPGAKTGATVVKLTKHVHDWKFTADGATLTAECVETAGTCSVSNNKVSLTLSASSQNYSDSAYTGASLEGGVEWTSVLGESVPGIKYVGRENTSYTESTMTPTNAGTYTAKIEFDGKFATKDFEITKAEPTIVTKPTASAITYGQTLSGSNLTGGAVNGVNSVSVSGAFAWSDGSIKPAVSDSGKTEYEVTFTPTGDAAKNYKAATGKVTLTVNKADYTDTELVKTASVNLQAKKDESAEVDLPALPEGASYGDVTNANTELFTVGAITDGKVTITAAKDFAAEDMEDKTFTVAVNADANHNNAKVTVTVKLFDKKIQTITAENVTVAYGDTGKSISAVTTTGGGALSYILKSGDAVEVDAAGALTIKKAGTAVITVNAAENDEYEAATKDVTVTVDKGEISPSVSISGWIEGESANAPSVAGNTGNGDVTYKYKEKTAETSAYSTEVPTAAGEYTLKAEIAETDNYKSGVATVDFTIAEPSGNVLATSYDTIVTKEYSVGKKNKKEITIGYSNDETVSPLNGVITVNAKLKVNMLDSKWVPTGYVLSRVTPENLASTQWISIENDKKAMKEFRKLAEVKFNKNQTFINTKQNKNVAGGVYAIRLTDGNGNTIYMNIECIELNKKLKKIPLTVTTLDGVPTATEMLEAAEGNNAKTVSFTMMGLETRSEFNSNAVVWTVGSGKTAITLKKGEVTAYKDKKGDAIAYLTLANDGSAKVLSGTVKGNVKLTGTVNMKKYKTSIKVNAVK